MKRDKMSKEVTLGAIKEYTKLANGHGFGIAYGEPLDLQKANLYASLGILRALQYLVEAS